VKRCYAAKVTEICPPPRSGPRVRPRSTVPIALSLHCRRALGRGRRKSNTANCSTVICGWALQSIFESASMCCVQKFSLAIDVPRPCRSQEASVLSAFSFTNAAVVVKAFEEYRMFRGAPISRNERREKETCQGESSFLWPAS
jgi:hypothetical protein